MSQERQERQKSRQEADVVSKLRKYYMRIWTFLLLWLIGDCIKDAVREKLTEWILPYFGPVGRWILGNPFSLVTVGVIVILSWLAWSAASEAFPSQGLVLNAEGTKVIRQKLDSKSAAAFVITALAAVALVGYGSYRYYTVPLPIIVGLSHAEFLPNYKGYDLYIVVNLKNHSDALVPVSTDLVVTARGEEVPTEPTTPMQMAPFEEVVQRVELQFRGNEDLRNAYLANQIKIRLTVKYNDRRRLVTYKFAGLVDARSASDGHLGNIDVLQDQREYVED